MKTYTVQKRVSTENITEYYDASDFDNLKDAELFYQNSLTKEVNLAGEYRDGEHREYYSEELILTEFDNEYDNIEDLKSKFVYMEGTKDKNNYRGNYASWYWFIAKFDGTELVYDFYNNGKDLNLEYENVKESELKDWYNFYRK